MRSLIIGAMLSVFTVTGASAQVEPRLVPVGVFGPTRLPSGPSTVFGTQSLILNNGAFVLKATATGAYYGRAPGFGSETSVFHDANGPGYFASSCAYYHCDTFFGAEEYARDFFVFDLSGVSVPIFAATLSIGNFEADTGTYLSWDVTTPISLLEQSWMGPGPRGSFSFDPEALAIFHDLESGESYARTPFSPADDGSQIMIRLDPFALDSINAAEGGSWAIGGSVVPEPSSWALTLAGFGAIAYAYGRRRRSLANPPAKLA
jgi:hypothetical protein